MRPRLFRPGSGAGSTRRAGRESGRPLRGPGSIFLKGLRDSRRAILLAGLGLGLSAFSVGLSSAANTPTAELRLQAVSSMANTPAMSTLYGIPIGVEHLGGMIAWREDSFLMILMGLWSVVALSGALAGEAHAGSLEMLAGTPLSRRRIALEKVAVHVVGLFAAATMVGGLAWLAGVFYAQLPGDEISPVAALVHFWGTALVALVAGSVAFAVSPFLSRGASAGVGLAALFGAFMVGCYADLVAPFGAIRNLSWFTWTAHNQPLAGSWDLVSLVPVGLLIVALLGAGVAGFERRDMGSAIPLPRLGLPGRRFLLGGPARQSFLETRAQALAWGIGLGIGLYLIAAGSSSLTDTVSSDSGAQKFVKDVFGDADWTSPRGLLQLAWAWFGYLVMALVGTTLVSGLASDERERRLDLLLSTPVSRSRWFAASGLGLYASLALLTLVLGIATSLGTTSAGLSAVEPFAGVWVGFLYGAALVGIALAVLGLGLVEYAPLLPAALGIGFYFWDVVGSIFRLPAEVTSLSLTHHLGRPMAGAYDWPGMTLLLALALGGLVLGAWGLGRRDLSR
jgi:ABC-2 type transport system permease protein